MKCQFRWVTYEVRGARDMAVLVVPRAMMGEFHKRLNQLVRALRQSNVLFDEPEDQDIPVHDAKTEPRRDPEAPQTTESVATG